MATQPTLTPLAEQIRRALDARELDAASHALVEMTQMSRPLVVAPRPGSIQAVRGQLYRTLTALIDELVDAGRDAEGRKILLDEQTGVRWLYEDGDDGEVLSRIAEEVR